MNTTNKGTSENQTILDPWTISSLKAYVELQIKALSNEMDLKFEARDTALELQFKLDQEHFKSLNNEAARLLKNVEITVSRDTWDAFQTNDRAWKANTERTALGLLPRLEFQTYKETAEKASNLGAGKWQGALQLISIVSSFAAIAGVAVVLFK